MHEKMKATQFQTPDKKVTYGGMLGAAMFLIAWSVTAFTGVVIPAEPALALQTILVGILQYYTKNSPADVFEK